MFNPLLSRKLRQFSYLSKKLNRLLAKGQFEALSTTTRKKYIRKLHHLYQRLAKFQPRRKLIPILAAAGMLIGVGTMGTANAQAYDAPVINPYGLTTDSADSVLPNAIDLDGDGDLDIMLGNGDGIFDYFENIGSATSPAFAPFVRNPFGLATQPYGNFLAFSDLDNDGDYDILSGNGYGTSTAETFYYENTGTATVPAFSSPVVPAFGIPSFTQFAFVELVDIDGDGDDDLFVGEGNDDYTYFENLGTPAIPNFSTTAQINPFGLSINITLPAGTFDDVDGDGDYDLLIGDYSGDYSYFQNIGTATMPSFAAPVVNAFGLFNQGQQGLQAPRYADLDADGDLDVLVGDYSGRIIYFEDTTIVASLTEDLLVESFNVYPNPANDFVQMDLALFDRAGDASYQLLDLMGRNVLEGDLAPNQVNYHERIDLNGLSTGLYTLQVSAGSLSLSRKIVIK